MSGGKLTGGRVSGNEQLRLVEHQVLYEFDNIVLAIGCIAVGAALGTFLARSSIKEDGDC